MKPRWWEKIACRRGGGSGSLGGSGSSSVGAVTVAAVAFEEPRVEVVVAALLESDPSSLPFPKPPPIAGANANRLDQYWIQGRHYWHHQPDEQRSRVRVDPASQ